MTIIVGTTNNKVHTLLILPISFSHPYLTNAPSITTKHMEMKCKMTVTTSLNVLRRYEHAPDIIPPIHLEKRLYEVRVCYYSV
jgi:hypothetical protein